MIQPIGSVYGGRSRVAVRIQGESTRTDRAYLELTRRLSWRLGSRGPWEKDIEILSPYARAIPFIGRAEELTGLWTWLENGRPLSIRVLTSRGGGGKTRLALELCDQAAARGWDAGFATDVELERFFSQPDLLAWGWKRPTLVVVDSAAAHAGRLHPWLVELSGNLAASGVPLRLLLLERCAAPESGWWREAFGGGGRQDLRSCLDPPEAPYALLPLLDAAERREVFAATLRRMGGPLLLPADSELDRRLAELSWSGEPLFLMMAGLVASRAGLEHALAMSPTGLALEVADRELARIRTIGKASGVSPWFLADLVGTVTLCQGLPRSAAKAVIDEELRAFRFPGAGDPSDIYRALHEALPGTGGDLAPVLPEVVGEAVILLTLGEKDAGTAVETVARAAVRARGRVEGTVVRLVQDYGEVYPESLDWLSLLSREGQIPKAGERPETTVILQESGCDLAADAVERLRSGDHQKDQLAAWLNSLANRLSGLGRGDEALAAGHEAVALYRELAAARPDCFQPDFAMALNNQAIRLSALGRQDEALAAGLEAVAIRRALAAASPEDFQPNLANSLNTFSAIARESGQIDLAYEAIQEAFHLLLPFFHALPAAFGDWMAGVARQYLEVARDAGRPPAPEHLAALQESGCLQGWPQHP